MLACDPSDSATQTSQSSSQAEGESAESAKALRSSVNPGELRADPDRITRIEISGPQSSVTIERAEPLWRIVSPLEYPASQVAIDAVLGVVAGVEVIAAEAETEPLLKSRGLDGKDAVTVKAWAGDEVKTHFRVGYGSREATYVQRVSDPRILTIRDWARPAVNKSVDDFRHPVITDLDSKLVEKVTYRNAFGQMELVADSAAPGRFRLEGAHASSFDVDRASKGVHILCHLTAKGFLESPVPRDAGLVTDKLARVTLQWREGGERRTMELWVGPITNNGHLHVRTSLSEQVFLVAANLESTLVAQVGHFESRGDSVRSDDPARPRAIHEGHSHDVLAAPPTLVPTELMQELRRMAREQVGK